jgi:hypothetical protein
VPFNLIHLLIIIFKCRVVRWLSRRLNHVHIEPTYCTHRTQVDSSAWLCAGQCVAVRQCSSVQQCGSVQHCGIVCDSASGSVCMFVSNPICVFIKYQVEFELSCIQVELNSILYLINLLYCLFFINYRVILLSITV